MPLHLIYYIILIVNNLKDSEDVSELEVHKHNNVLKRACIKNVLILM